MDIQELKRLAKELEQAHNEAKEVNIATLPIDDIHKLVKEGSCINQLLNYIGGLK